jgi:Predicted glycosyltransferases
MADPKVSTIVLNWNNAPDTEKCITSLLEQDYKNIDIVVVDNGSTDGSDKTLKQRFGGVRNIELIFLEKNTGFAEGNNIGIRRALEQRTDCVFILNNDVVVTPRCISTLVQVAESDGHIGIVGATNLFADDTQRIWHSGGTRNWGRKRFFDDTANILYDPNDQRIRDVDCVVGSSMLVKKAVIEKVGLMWAPYFLCFEEMDWCLRAKKSGFRVVAAMGAVVYHKVHASLNKTLEYYYLNRNYPIFMLRNCPPLDMPKAILFYLIGIPIEYIKLLISRDKERAAVLWHAHVDFLLHRYGERKFRKSY